MTPRNAALVALVAPCRFNPIRAHARTCVETHAGVAPQVPHPPQSRLLNLGLRVTRLGPDRRDPEAFNAAKSVTVADVRRLARAGPRIAHDAALNWGAP